MQRVRLASSPPMVMSSRSFQSASRSAFSSGSSASASSRMSGSAPLSHFQGLADLVVELLEAAILRGQLGQRAVLAGDGRQPGRIGQHLGIDELSLQLLEAAEFFVERIRHDQKSLRADDPHVFLGLGCHGRRVPRAACPPVFSLPACPRCVSTAGRSGSRRQTHDPRSDARLGRGLSGRAAAFLPRFRLA